MSVAIIGAGPTGITTARYLKEYHSEFDIYERRNATGGVWRDREESENLANEDIVALSPIYDTLRANTPKDAMQFKDLEYEYTKECFIPWKIVNKYLKKYVEKFELMKHILLGTEVTKISLINDEWKVYSRHIPTGKLMEKTYKRLAICTGHEEIPYIPEIEGASSFQGLQFHSKIYRNPGKYQNQNVLIIGVGPSGSDIAMQIATTANKVYMSHHRPSMLKAIFPPNLIQKPDVKKFTEDSVIFQDGSEELIDVIIYCTGYQYNYNYFDGTCRIKLGDRYLKNLYKQMVSIDYPNLIFCGLQRVYYMFPLAEQQGIFAAKFLAGCMDLPSKEDMLKDTEEWEQKSKSEGRQEHQFYDLECRGREYMRELSRTGGIPDPPQAVCDMFEVFYDNYTNQRGNYRDHVYKIVNSKFVYEPHSTKI